MKNFLTIQKEIWVAIKDNNDDQKFLVREAINDIYSDICMEAKYSWRQKTANIVTIAPYTTGNVTDVTNGGTAVTGSGTTWTSAMIGRRIRIGTDSQSYEISAVGSATSITLATQYDGTTISSTSTSYSIYQSFYKLARDFDSFETVSQQQSPMLIRELSRYAYDEIFPAPKNEGVVIWYVDAGLTLSAFYSTGTVAMTNNSAAVTGTGTTWTASMVGMTFKVRGDSDEYTISAFTSTTSITLDRVYSGATRSTEKYEIDPSGIRQIELYRIPSEARVIPYRYYYKHKRLIYDYDIPIIPEQYHDILVHGAKALMGLSNWNLFDYRMKKLAQAGKISTDEIIVRKTWFGERYVPLSPLPDNYPFQWRS